MMKINTPASAPLLLPVLAVLLLAAGCASSPAPAPAPGDEAQVAEPVVEPEAPTDASADAAPSPAPATATPGADATVTCYFGPSRQTLADGSVREGAELVLRHTFEPDESRIVEETVRFDPLPQVPARLYTTVYAVDGDAFTLEESEGQYAGSGTLEGEPWAWTGWTSDYALQSGIRVHAEYDFGRADGRAVLNVEREAFGPDGSAALTIHEELTEIGAEECAERLAESVTDGG